MNNDTKNKEKKELTLADLQNVRGAALAGKKIGRSEGGQGKAKHESNVG